VFGKDEADRPWTTLAKEGLERLKTASVGLPRTPGPDGWKERLGAALDDWRRAPPAQADIIAQSLLNLYRDDPEVASLRELLTPHRK
jgi:hypothetical protein